MAIGTVVEFEYPESDGQPMGESDVHRDWMIRVLDLLSHYYRGQRVYITGDLLLYYVQGDPKKFVVPDAFVVKDCPPGRRRVYKMWDEGKPPNFVLETTSKSTQQVDLVRKPRLYAQLGIKEYFLYDPTGEYLEPPLIGYRLNGGGYVPLEPDETGALESEELGLIFRLEQGDLVMYIKANGDRLFTAEEREEQAREREAQAREREEQAREHEAQAREREEQAQEREAQAREREEQARALAAREAEARQAAEAELARLREELARRRMNG